MAIVTNGQLNMVNIILKHFLKKLGTTIKCIPNIIYRLGLEFRCSQFGWNIISVGKKIFFFTYYLFFTRSLFFTLNTNTITNDIEITTKYSPQLTSPYS